MSWIPFNSLPEVEKEKIIQKELDYLLAEGVVVKVGDKYRMKTKKEIQQEIENTYNS
jgi:hypothetical protein